MKCWNGDHDELRRGNFIYRGAAGRGMGVLGKALKEKAKRRNDAAHGGNYLTYNDVCEDKGNVYDVIKEYKGMILELLMIIFPDKQ